jgi:hypothetical protein
MISALLSDMNCSTGRKLAAQPGVPRPTEADRRCAHRSLGGSTSALRATCSEICR